MKAALTWHRLRFGQASRLGRDVMIGLDRRLPTQRFLHGVLSGGALYDPPLVAVLTDTLQPGDTFIDIGSHVGYYALLAWQQVGRRGRVVAFEANPQTFHVLLANVLGNRAANLFAIHCALGDAEGTATLHISDTDEGLSSLIVPADRSVPVAMTTLDALHDAWRLEHVRMVKIDVEGFERQVIAGGASFFPDVRPESVVFEVNHTLEGIDPDADLHIRSHFEAIGYRCYLIRPWFDTPDAARFPSTELLALLRPGRRLAVDYGNILATRRNIAAPVFDP